MHMEFQSKKLIAIICLSVVTLFSLLGPLFAENIVVEDVYVGLILDMGSREGQIILSCISTALSDFYQLHKNYTTRLLLRNKDSKGKPLHALSAGDTYKKLSSNLIYVVSLIPLIYSQPIKKF
ncbi:unnamed protein product [Malus baccata var. baccata]